MHKTFIYEYNARESFLDGRRYAHSWGDADRQEEKNNNNQKWYFTPFRWYIQRLCNGLLHNNK